MVKYLGKLAQDIKDYFGYPKDVHLGIGRKVSPIYLVNPVPELQSMSSFDKALTQNQWYDALDNGTAVAAGAGKTLNNVRLNFLKSEQLTADETIEIRIIADDVDQTYSYNSVAATDYYLHYDHSAAYEDRMFVVDTVQVPQVIPFVGEYRSLKILFRKTTAAGANNTRCGVSVSLW